MAETTRTFQNMLNEYTPYKLLREEILKRVYFINKAQKDDSWLGGNLIVPFQGTQASSVSMDGLTESADITEDEYVRGNIDNYKEAWASLVFNYTDLIQHNKVSTQNFLRILPDQLEQMMNYFKELVSIQITGAKNFAYVPGTDEGGKPPANGALSVNRIDRFVIGQKVWVQNKVDTNAAPGRYLFVTAIDVNDSRVTFSLTKGGAAAAVAAYTAAAEAKFYYAGITRDNTKNFSSVRDALLSRANGGAEKLYGQTKTAYPYLQAVNIDGDGVTAANILDRLFDGYTAMKIKGKGMANEIVMSYKHLGSIMKLVEAQKGSFKVMPKDTKANLYAWDTIDIASVTGKRLRFVGVQEMQDDTIFYLDWSGIKFHSNGGFRKVQSPDGNTYYVERRKQGYRFICDMCLFGDLVVSNPGNCGIMYGINY